jgi:uroporphyrin-III C-methyltransferase / precorrin-2 dehydrogenase / sirohydrochlorin ferrochelatase
MGAMTSSAPVPYPVAVMLHGRRVLVVGGGHVAQRRVPGLLTAGADVHLVSPVVTPALEGLAGGGEISWHEREFEPADVDRAWYVVAATDRREVNEAVSAVAEQQRIFCVRADDGTRATAWTPASGRHDGLTLAVVANREPRRSAALRDRIIAGLRDGLLRDPGATHRGPAGVTLVGGGPGDPDLVTVAAKRALAQADVVVADRLAPRELLDDLAADVELVDVAKLPRGRAASQEAINEVIVARALAGKRVVRLKGGDGFVFGRGYEEVLACAEAGVPCTVVPGVTSALSVPALAGIPVTHRGVTHDFTVVSGHLPPDHPESLVDWQALGLSRGTVLLLMAVENLPAIVTSLQQHGRAPGTPVAIVCDGSMPTERTVLTTLGEAAAAVHRHEVRPPAVVVVGEVVAVANPAAYGEATGERR